MLYRPPSSRKMWDTTLYHEDDLFHLFYLNQKDSGTLGHAVSSDLINWQAENLLDFSGDMGEWNENGLPLTGCVIKHEDQFYLFGGSIDPRTQKQVIGVFLSNDLYEWQPYSGNPILEAQPPYFSSALSYESNMFSAWRDPKISRDSNGLFHAYICARMPHWDASGTGACVAHLSSPDLINWEYLSPLVKAGNKVRYCEVPDFFAINGVYYITFLDHSWGGGRIHTPSRDDAGGTFYLIGETSEGPFSWPEDPLLIGTGHHRIGPWAARIIEYQGHHLLYHHQCSQQGSVLALPKVIKQNKDNSLSLYYYSLLEKLEKDVIKDGFSRDFETRKTDQGQWELTQGRLIGSAPAMGTAAMITRDTKDVHLKCTIRMTEGAVAGVVLRVEGVFDPDEFMSPTNGVGIMLDFERQMLRIENLDFIGIQGWGLNTGDFMAGHSEEEFDTCKRELEYNIKYRLRCVVRAEFYEIYLGDELIFTQSMKQAPLKGGIDCFVEKGRAEFNDFRLATLKEL